ncbi:hypothetical protein GCM10010387_34770 [Streptomyces inusitatus]|uniref:LamG-like jellyroll fold domain-containing protein n=1 Tax=Streptomyces inusitatus TaxID=68221 RepID=A0A918Q9Y3_9ACTN|nr:LamG domain-containing protein [Streptomyces inusitatus]GGZ37634.1 hypothetical protein GCM10010387_34770 [Streptomyces inusitatus]
MSGRNTRGILLRTVIATVVVGAVTVTGLTGLGSADPGAGPGANLGTAADQPSAATDKPVRTEAEALRTASRIGRKVEVLGLRSEHRETFANPDGTFTAREYTDPIRTVKNGVWHDIDKTLVQRADGSWGPKAATVSLSFSGGEAGKPFAVMERVGREMALTWPYGKLPAPVVTGDTATYPDALPGVDLTVRAEADGFGHLLVVKTPEAAADPRLARIDFGLSTDGLKFTEDASGALKAEDAAVGGTVFEAGKPAMWDSASVKETVAAPQGPKAIARSLRAAAPAERPSAAPAPALLGPGGGGRTAPLGMELSEGKLTLIPDQKLLKGESTVFPVVIDPVTKTTTRSAWTGVMSGKPNEQDWKFSKETGVGKCPTDYSPASCNGVDVRRLLFTMSTSFYKDKQIVSTTFSARVAHIYSATPTPEPIRLYRIGGKNHSITSSTNWSNTANLWDSHLQTVDKAISPTSCSSSGSANLHFEGGKSGALTNQMKTAAAEGWSSLTLGLRASDESRFAEWKRICGNAYLSVEYNNLPRQIKTSDMSMNPGGVCTWGADRPYAEVRPQLQVVVSDPDHGNGRTEKVRVEFKVEWTEKNGQPGGYSETTKIAQSPSPGTRITHSVRSIPENVTVYWSARATDGYGWGPWSNEGSAQRCEFIYDKSKPGAPNVLSKEYPANSVYHEGVGKYGTFTFSPNTNDSIYDGDVVKYLYAFDGTAGPPKSVAAAHPGGPASVTWMPTTPGRHWVEVVAVDKVENPSTKMYYSFLIAEGAPVTAQWDLADKPGSPIGHDRVVRGEDEGDFSADAGPGVTFGVQGPGGKADYAARLDGTKDAHLDVGETVIDTSKSFSVSAWVRPADLTRDMAVVSQDGTGEPGFTLGYDAAAKTWAFSAPVTDVETLGSWKAVASGITVVKDQWVMLTGVYDAHTTEMRLYVNATAKTPVKRASVWRSYGAFQIGRTTAKSGYRDHFAGDLAEIRVFDRVVPAGEVADMITVKPERKGYWQLDQAPNGVSPETGGGAPLTLAGGAAIHVQNDDPLSQLPPALVGSGHLELKGDGGYAATASAPVTGGTSFTVAARVQLTSLDPTKAQTVLSLPGAMANRFSIRYAPAVGELTVGRWELAVAGSDTANAKVKRFTDHQALPTTDGSSQHLAVVYDAFANEIRLYVNGEFAEARGTDNTLWPTKNGLQVGRSLLGADKEYFAGAVDEVRVYQGAADHTAVGQMAVTPAMPEL